MTKDIKNRQPEGIPAGGQFAPTAHTEPTIALTEAPATITWDTPEDEARYQEAVEFMRGADIEGAVQPLYTQYRPEDGTDALILQVDGRNMVIHHAGSMDPQVAYGDDENDAWTFRMEAGDGAGKTEYEQLAYVVERSRHDAACQEAWRGMPDSFEYGENTSVKDFGVRYGESGARIITLDISSGRGYYEIGQYGEDEVAVFTDGGPTEEPWAKLDELATGFDENHEPGTGPLRFKTMMQAAADRAAADPGYNPRGTVSS